MSIQGSVNAVDKGDLGQEGGQPAEGVERPLSEGAVERDQVLARVAPEADGCVGQHDRVVLGQGERFAIERDPDR